MTTLAQYERRLDVLSIVRIIPSAMPPFMAIRWLPSPALLREKRRKFTLDNYQEYYEDFSEGDY